MVNNEMDAEDILQASFMDVFTHLDSFNYKSTPGAWIKRIVINNCLNFLKKRRLYFEEVDQIGEIIEEDPEEPRLNVNAINDAIKKLPDGYKTVFNLYALEGYDHKEIGDILGVTEATSKSQYSRARKKLKEILLADKGNQVFI
jgi:RNA polymerase sigma-70 factor (ECF subfamily)